MGLVLWRGQEGAVGSPEPQPSVVLVALNLAGTGRLAPDLRSLSALSLCGREQCRYLARVARRWECRRQRSSPRGCLERCVGIGLLLPLRNLGPCE